MDTGRRNFVQATLEDYLLETTSDLGDEGEEDLDSCSSFSLQQCIDEFRARRIRRNSVQISEQRDETQQNKVNNGVNADTLADADLISQNRSNKEHERKCKPCKNGFCYCFTSDSGDGGCGNIVSASTNAARGAAYSFRSARRSRKSESGQVSAHAQQPLMATQRLKERRSAPASFKTTASLANDTETIKPVTPKKLSVRQTNATKRPLTAVSRLETTSHDAPLIHIVQELRENCVISEVRVNKHKLQARKEVATKEGPRIKSPRRVDKNKKCKSPSVTPVKATSSPESIETISGDAIPVARLEIGSKSPRRKSGAGRLLEKRLSQANIQYKPRDLSEPPPKPPRASTGSQAVSSDCSLTTTSPSVREAERIVDEFLTKKGVPLPKVRHETTISDKQVKKRMSFPLAHKEEHMHIPTCPSLSDIECPTNAKTTEKQGNKNFQKDHEEPIKDISLGWREPKVSEMLNYDSNGNRKEFKSQAAQTEPQTIGWQIPPKLSLDTVDGAVSHNLASNLATKDTPVKRQFNTKRSKPTANNKFGWSWPAAPKCSRSFLRQSKKKILKLVTPKKDNRERTKFQARKTPYRNVSIQTSLQDFAQAEESCTQIQFSPPGSYHSAAVQTSNDITPQYSTATNSHNNNTSDSQQFDFTRKVNSPPRKSSLAPRSSQRKLDFPSSICDGRASFCFNQASTAESAPSFGSVGRQTAGSRTYRSYQTDLDQDLTLSKMGLILSNIRARLEASDEYAIRTFEEIERREQQQLTGFDCPDSLGIRRKTEIMDVNVKKTNLNRSAEKYEPIYSEIEEDSIHVTESPEFDNKTGIESSSSVAAVVTTTIDFETLYAKVNKPAKKSTHNDSSANNTYTPLGQFLHNSLRKKQTQMQDNKCLSTVIEPSVSDDVSYSSPPLETSSEQTRYDSPTPSALSHCQSLNNIRVMEHHSPPKKNRNLSKSDLSLHRSEIFLENLCRSELIVNHGTLERLEKIDNQRLTSVDNSALDADVVSYDIPVEMFNKDVPTTATTNNSPQKFLTKPTNVYINELTTRLSATSSPHITYPEPPATHSKSCPVTPQKFYNTTAKNFPLNESNLHHCGSNESKYDLINITTHSTTEPGSASTRYKRIKQILQKSFRKSKNFVKYRRASLPTPVTNSATLATTITTATETTTLKPETPHPPQTPTQMATSCLNLDELFQLDEAASVTEQIARAVNICRQLPELETSHEIVEAERLLLYSTLRREICKLKANAVVKSQAALLERRFAVQSIRLPVVLENLADYFNYYFTITFECDGHIYSTQSTAYRHGEVVFQNCDFEFILHKSDATNADEPCINCNIFMLRLRKIAAAMPAANDNNDLMPHDVTPLPSTPPSSASSLEGIVSRFRLYASFNLNASCFKPYKLAHNSFNGEVNQTTQENFISLSAFQHCEIPLKLSSTSTTPTEIENSLPSSIVIIGNAVAQFPQLSFSGFLHVQDPFRLHNWNWRWCTLLGLHLQIWADAISLDAAPLMTLNLADQVQTLPLTVCNRELCARARSFCVQCSTYKVDTKISVAAVFFAADNDTDLSQWLKHLNETFNFIVEWMQ